MDEIEPITDWLKRELKKALRLEMVEEMKRTSTFHCSITEKHPPHLWEPIEGWTEEPFIATDWCIGSSTAPWQLKGLISNDG